MNKTLVTLTIAVLTQFSAVAADLSKATDIPTAASKAMTNVQPKTPSTDLTSAHSNKININTAGEAELKLLKGIGDAKAKAIVEYRKQYGQFATVEDLTKVSGIGGKVLEDNRHLLTL